MTAVSKQADTLFQSIIDAHPNPCVVHVDFKPCYANPAFASFSGLPSVEDVLDLETLKVLFVKEHWPEAEQRYQEVIDGLAYSDPLRIEHMDVHGNPKIAEITDTVVDWQGERAMCTYISVVTDIIKRERLLHDMAMNDELTGAKNRRYLVEQFQHSDRRYKEGYHYLALIDLDFFKRINDTWGHAMGDRLLRALASTLNPLFDEAFPLVRLGGEEFAMLLTASSSDELHRKLDHIRQTIKATSVAENSQVSCSASIGVSGYRQGDTFGTIAERADKALYQAKENGRDCVVFCEEPMHEENL